MLCSSSETRNVVVIAAVLFAMPVAASAAAPAPTTSPTSAPSKPSDPCTTMLAIVTRPTVTTTACTVRPNHVLVENGWNNTVVTGPRGGNTAAYPQSEVRIGTEVTRLEVDLTPPTWIHSSVGGPVIGGPSDVAAGLSYEIGYSAKAVWAVNAVASAPVGSPAFSASGSQYTGNFNWSYSLSSKFGLSGTFGFDSQTGMNANGHVQRFFNFIPSIYATATLPRTSQAFLEYVYYSHAGVGLGSKNLIDLGLQHDINPHVQADVEYGFSPTVISGQTQHYVGFGLSFMN
jgi:hypothetical protein